MTEEPLNEIDELLANWSTAHEPSRDHLEQLRAEVEQSLREGPAGSGPIPSRNSTTWDSFGKLILSIAAVVAVIVSAAWWIGQSDDEKRDAEKQIASEQVTAPIERFSDAQRRQKQSLLAELDRMFDGKRVWFAETETEVVLGGDVKPIAGDVAAERTVAMRLVLAKRSAATEQWQRVWATDVVSRTDQVVQFASNDPEQPEASFTAWTHVLPDGLVDCDVDLKWNDGKFGQLSDNLLLSPGDTQLGASRSVDGVEYRLFHTVTMLDKITT